MDIEKLKERKQQIEAELGMFVEQANQQIAMQRGAIAVLIELITEAETPAVETQEQIED